MIDKKNERGNRTYHLLDRYLGIPLIYLLGIIKKNCAASPSFPKRIAILETAAIGDAILLDAITKDLKGTWPKARQVFFCTQSNYVIVQMLPAVDEVILLPLLKPWTAASIIRRARAFDLWFDFGPWSRINALYSCLAQASCKIGFRTPGQYRHYGYDIQVEHRGDVHEIENYRNLVRAAGVAPQATPALEPDATLLANIPGLRLDRPYAVLHIFAGGSRAYMKEWPEACWLKVIRHLWDKGCRVVFTGGPHDAIRMPMVIDGLQDDPRVLNLVGRINLKQLAALMAAAKIVISVNTGVMHLAVAVGASLIALHGPTSPIRWGPLSAKAVVVKPVNLKCAPCLNLGFEYGCANNDCLSNISPERVLVHIDQFLDL